MARLELLPEVLRDFESFLDHMVRVGTSDATEQIEDIIEALQILTRSPLIGRPVADGDRELVIGRAVRGYVALYRFVEIVDTAFVLAIRIQRESGYQR